MLENFMNSVSLLRGKECWNVELGIESNLFLEIGRKVTHDPPRKNKNGNVKLVGEYGFLIFSTWRIRNSQKILTSSREEQVCVLPVLKALVGKTVTQYSLLNSFYDFSLSFEGDIFLDVFCDVVDTELSHYYFTTFNSLYSVDAGPRLTSENICRQLFEDKTF